MSGGLWAKCACGVRLSPAGLRYRIEALNGEACGHGKTAVWLCVGCFEAMADYRAWHEALGARRASA